MSHVVLTIMQMNHPTWKEMCLLKNILIFFSGCSPRDQVPRPNHQVYSVDLRAVLIQEISLLREKASGWDNNTAATTTTPSAILRPELQQQQGRRRTFHRAALALPLAEVTRVAVLSGTTDLDA